MKCETPYYNQAYDLYCPCGKCVPCKIVRKMSWVTRMKLEAKDHEHTCFVTLTYDDDNLVYGGTGAPTLCPDDVTLFFKRLRKALWRYHGDPKIRYFICGEYGSESKRPHYHAIIFGIDASYSEVISEAWGKGFIQCNDLLEGGIEYVAGYCVKKSQELKTFYEEAEVTPEFFRSSIGLGRSIVKQVASQVKKYNMVDSPRFVYEGKKKMWLTKYWIKCIRELCFSEDYIKRLKIVLMSEARKFFYEALQTNPKALRFFKARLFNEAYSFLFKELLRANLLKYSRFLNKRNKICRSVQNLI